MTDPDVGDLVKTTKQVFTSPIGTYYIPEGAVGIILHHRLTFSGRIFQTYFSTCGQQIFLDEHEFYIIKKA